MTRVWSARVWSIGAGAVGGTVAARLARSGIEPVVIDANRDHVLRLRHPGLHVDGAVTPLAAYTPDDLGDDLDDPPDVVLLAVRSDATSRALQLLVERFRADTDIVSLQNGLNEDHISAIVGEDRTVGCVVGFGATWIEPGHISLDAEGELVIGRLDGSSDERLDRVRELLQKAFPTRVTANVLGALWSKMHVNSVTVLGALVGMRLGEFLSDEARKAFASAVVDEGLAVARAAGVEGVRAPDLHYMAANFPMLKSVTWRDFERGRPTEIDAVTGEIVRRGGALGVAVPISAAVYGMLREIEAGARRSDAANLLRPLRRSHPRPR